MVRASLARRFGDADFRIIDIGHGFPAWERDTGAGGRIRITDDTLLAPPKRHDARCIVEHRRRNTRGDDDYISVNVANVAEALRLADCIRAPMLWEASYFGNVTARVVDSSTPAGAAFFGSKSNA